MIHTVPVPFRTQCFPLSLRTPRVGNETPARLVERSASRPIYRCTLITTPDTSIGLNFPGVVAGRPPAQGAALPQNAAYVIYTSGSTGDPKGVVVTHEGIGALVQQIRASYGLDASSRVCHLASPGFDTAIVEHLASAAAGATLVIAPPGVYAGPELTQLLARRHLTHLLITPSALATLDCSALTDIETIIIGGESAPRDVVAAWSPGRRMLNAYGPTETTCSVTMTDSLVADEAIGIGTAMVGVEIHLLDRTLRPVPAGAIGEVYIATTGIARGYSNRAAATATRFVAHPLGGDGRRLFRSGDMARSRADGSLAFVGRTDDQVKIRGNRVELGEIDAALRSYPRVTAAASTTRRTHSGDLRIDGYIVCDGAQPLDPQEVRRFLANTLPGSAVPATITMLKSLPLTVNRKLDRTALPEPELDVATGADTEPRSCTEEAVARAFSDVLGLAAIDMHASFFDLGGDSLTATGVIARLNTDLDVDIGIRDLVDAGSVRALSTFIETHTPHRPRQGRPVPGASESIAVIPLAPQQTHIDRRAQLPLYNLPFTMEITGPFDTSAAAAAFIDVLVRHRSLRTVYPDSPWGPRQVVVDDPSRLQSVLGVAGFDPHAVDEVLAAPFDVRGELPIRATLFEKAPGIHLLACTVHHIAADGWSLRLLAQDFTVAYRARALGSAPGWAEMPLQYADFSVWAAQRPGVPDLDFWSREFEGLAFDTAVETDRPRTASWDFTGDRIDLQLAVDITEGVDRVAHANGTGRFTVLRAGLLVLLARMNGTSDLVIGTPIAGRTDPELEAIVGTFVNTVAIRSDIAAAVTFEDVIAVAHASELRALDHSSVSFETVAAHIDPEPHLGRHPLFQVALSLDVFTDSQIDLGATHVDITPRPLGIAKCDLHFHLVERRDAGGRMIGMDVGIVYPTALFDRDTVRLLGELYDRILRRMITGPGVLWSTPA
jgi:amino acid adenylation domain-containing protein